MRQEKMEKLKKESEIEECKCYDKSEFWMLTFSVFHFFH